MYRSPFTCNCSMTTPFKKPGNWAAGYHTGEDWIAEGDRTLVSPADGHVSFVGYDSSYGNHIVIHTDDRKCILMAHLESTPTVKQGQHITAGTKVGVEGNTGNSSGYHLHIEVQSIPEWNYAKNLLKPSDYIDFSDFGNHSHPLNTGLHTALWQNGSTKEWLFTTTRDCKSNYGSGHKYNIGYLAPYAKATLIDVHLGCHAIICTVGSDYKVGYVEYDGKQTDRNFPDKLWSNGSTPENVFNSIHDLEKGKNVMATVKPYETARYIGRLNGYSIIEFKEKDCHWRIGFVKYEGGV